MIKNKESLVKQFRNDERDREDPLNKRGTKYI
jgi:hypothetical protein